MVKVRDRAGLLATALAAAWLLAGCTSGSTPPAAQALPAVEVVTVQPRALALTRELPGRIEPVRVAEVRARVAGIVLSRHFQEGADVKVGQLLFRIDPAPFQATLARAKAELAKADAAVADTHAIVKRYTPLAKIEAVSQQDFDTAQAALQIAQAARQAAQADVQTAQLNLSYATVTAPISGRIGRALVTEGALVGQGEATPMATVQQLHPVYADFTQPVADALRLREAQADGRLAAQRNGEAGRIRVTVEGTDKTREGRLLFAGIAVDRSSGQISLRGEFPNQDGLLLPGMYVRVTTGQGTDPQAILVPQRAVKRSTDGKPQVLVLGEGDVVQARLVQTGSMHGSDWHIVQGLKAGECVLVGGPAVNPGDRVTVAAPAAPAAAATGI